MQKNIEDYAPGPTIGNIDTRAQNKRSSEEDHSREKCN